MKTETTGLPVRLKNGRFKAPSASKLGYTDTFINGINRDRWEISHRKWGPLPDYKGVLADNVSYTKDGILLLKCQGLYSCDKPLSGAAIVSKATHGAGSYSVAMKVMPRLGACNALWTYHQAEAGAINHEIDIELPGHITEDGSRNEPSYMRVLNTNWLANTNNMSNGVVTETYANDGQWHLYRFDWHTAPIPRIDYYVDNVLTHSETNKIPFKRGILWLGAWLPRFWCGTADFEQDYMMVDWINYEPFDEPSEDTIPAPGNTATDEQYPSAPVEMPETNLISDGDFEGKSEAFDLSAAGAQIVAGNAKSGKWALKLTGGAARQTISAVYGGMKFDFACALKCDKGIGALSLTFLDRYDNIISSDKFELKAKTGEYETFNMQFAAVANSRKLEVRLSSQDNTVVHIDDIKLTLAK